MDNITRGIFSSILALALAISAGSALAQSKGRIVCWKDKSGKTVGCGDSVPPEYQNNATQELDKRGVVRKSTDSVADEAAKVKAPVADLARQKAQKAQADEEERKQAEQRRQDNALINTFYDEKEIDAKRDRDLQVLILQVSQLKTSLKNANARQAQGAARINAIEKSKKPVPDNLMAEKKHDAEETAQLQQRIAAKEKEMSEIRARYDEYKKRFAELKGTQQPAASPTPAGPSPKK